MPAMSNIQKHPKSGVWRIRRAIPVAARFAFGGKREYLKSLGTKNYKEAQSKAFPILAEVHRRIDKACAGVLYETDEETCSAAYAFIELDGGHGGCGLPPIATNIYSIVAIYATIQIELQRTRDRNVSKRLFRHVLEI